MFGAGAGEFGAVERLGLALLGLGDDFADGAAAHAAGAEGDVAEEAVVELGPGRGGEELVDAGAVAIGGGGIGVDAGDVVLRGGEEFRGGVAGELEGRGHRGKLYGVKQGVNHPGGKIDGITEGRDFRGKGRKAVSHGGLKRAEEGKAAEGKRQGSGWKAPSQFCLEDLFSFHANRRARRPEGEGFPPSPFLSFYSIATSYS